MSYPTRFENLHDLARLPWFGLREGRLVVDDPSVPEAIDMHTHLALSYVRRNRVDLFRAGEVEHYLPTHRAIDLEVYANQNFTPADLAALERDLSIGSLGAEGMRASHTIPNLVREMGELRVSRSVLLPIDFPVLSNNARNWLDAARGQGALIGFGSVHPYARDLDARLDEQVALGARGIKVHPAVQMVRPDDPRAMKLYRACGRRQLPILWHCGPVDIETRLGRYLSQVRHYERAIAETPETTFLLGHSGALQMPEALGYARRYPNVWLELSSQSLGGVRRILDEGPRDRVVFGTDWPFYHQAFVLAKVFMATDADPRLRRDVLHDNAARLLGLPPATT